MKTHLQRLFTKLDVDDRTRAVTVAIERGLLPQPARADIRHSRPAHDCWATRLPCPVAMRLPSASKSVPLDAAARARAIVCARCLPDPCSSDFGVGFWQRSRPLGHGRALWICAVILHRAPRWSSDRPGRWQPCRGPRSIGLQLRPRPVVRRRGRCRWLSDARTLEARGRAPGRVEPSHRPVEASLACVRRSWSSSRTAAA